MMLVSTLSAKVQRRLLPNYLSICRSFCDQSRLNDTQDEINRVVLCGTTLKPSNRWENGLTRILLKTIDEKYGNATHSILANSKDLHIPENQRIYVTGVLQLKSDRTIDGTFVKVGTVRSFQTSLITNSCLDLNMIELKAPVATDVVDEEESSMFVVATHNYSPRGGKQITTYHTVRVYDESLREIVRASVGKGKIVYLVGRLQTERYTNAENELKTSTIIEATNILTMNIFAGLAEREIV